MGLKQWYENLQLITPLKRYIFPWIAKLASPKDCYLKDTGFPRSHVRVHMQWKQSRHGEIG